MGFFRMAGYQVGSEYTIHNIHQNENRNWKGEWYKIISIDPGVKNLAIRVELRHKDTNQTKHLLFERNNFEIDNEQGIMVSMLNYLESNWHLMKDPHFVIIEKQLPFNYQAVRISQHILTYFYMKCQNNDVRTFIIEISPQIKSKVFTKTKMNPKEVKKWCVDKAYEVLRKNKDEDSITIIEESKKKDDLSDVVIQIEAFWMLIN